MKKGELTRRRFLKHSVYGSLLFPLLPYWEFAHAQAANPKRLLLIFYSNGFGSAGSLATGAGSNFSLHPYFQNLNSYKSDMIAMSNINLGIHDMYKGDHGGHIPGAQGIFSGYLPIVDASGKAGPAPHGPSIDQILANWHKSQNTTKIPSLDLKMKPGGFRGGAVTFSAKNQAVKYLYDPALAFDRLFKDFTIQNNETLVNRLWQRKKSVLDVASQDLKALNFQLPAEGKRILDDHLQNIREIERTIATNMQELNKNIDIPSKPGSINVSSNDHYDSTVEIFSRLIDAGFRHDITRVASIVFGGNAARFKVNSIGATTDHHTYSHESAFMRENNGGDATLGSEKYIKWYMSKVKNLMDKLSGKTGLSSENLLNSSSTFISSEAGTTHMHYNIPGIIIGNNGGYFKTNQHIDFKQDKKKHIGLLLSLLHSAGASHIKKVGMDYSPAQSGILSELKS